MNESNYKQGLSEYLKKNGRGFSSKNPNHYHNEAFSGGGIKQKAFVEMVYYKNRLSNQCKSDKDKWQQKYNQQPGTYKSTDFF